MGEFSNWYGWHYAGSLQGLFWMQSIDPVTIALGAWQPFMGRAEGLFRQDCCMNTMKSEQHGGTKPPRLQWELVRLFLWVPSF